MRPIRGQRDGFTLPYGETLSRDLDLGGSVKNQDKRIERRRMFAQAFTLIEGKQSDRSTFVLQQNSADNRAVLILKQGPEFFNLRILSSVSNFTHNLFPNLDTSAPFRHERDRA